MAAVVRTTQGELRGSVVDGVQAFLGVPYAAPPIGANRLRPPRPARTWEGVRDATRYGPSPPQVAPPAIVGSDWDTDVTGEDCLLLNLWTPDPAATGPPVMVWIQGGQFAGVPPRREEIAALPVERLRAAQAEVGAEVANPAEPWGEHMVLTMPWQPVVDGEVLPARPLDRIEAGAAGEVDLMVGTNTDDWRLFLAVTGEIAQVTDEALSGPVRVHGRQAVAAYGLPVETALPAYRERYPDTAPGELLSAVQTDWWVRIPAMRLADAHASAHAETYAYEVAWGAPGLGAVHGLEVPFVFDRVSKDARLFGPMLGDCAPQELAAQMHAAWVWFAGKGDPGWPTYDLDRRATMRFGTPSAVVDDPRAWERALWEGIR